MSFYNVFLVKPGMIGHFQAAIYLGQTQGTKEEEITSWRPLHVHGHQNGYAHTGTYTLIRTLIRTYKHTLIHIHSISHTRTNVCWSMMQEIKCSKVK